MTNADLPRDLSPESDARSTQPPAQVPETRDSETSSLMILVALALLTVTGIGLHFISSVFTPIFLALTLVLAVRPIGQWMIKYGLPAWLAGSVVVAVLVLIIFGLLGITILLLTPVPQTLMNYSINFENTMRQTNEWLNQFGFESVNLSNFFDQINFNSVIGLAWELVDRLSSVGGLIMIVGVAAFFITFDTTTTASRKMLINKRHANIGQALSDFERRVRSYWVVSTFFGFIVAVVDGFALQVMGILGVDMGLLGIHHQLHPQYRLHHWCYSAHGDGAPRSGLAVDGVGACAVLVDQRRDSDLHPAQVHW